MKKIGPGLRGSSTEVAAEGPAGAEMPNCDVELQRLDGVIRGGDQKQTESESRLLTC